MIISIVGIRCFGHVNIVFNTVCCCATISLFFMVSEVKMFYLNEGLVD